MQHDHLVLVEWRLVFDLLVVVAGDQNLSLEAQSAVVDRVVVAGQVEEVVHQLVQEETRM